MIRTQYVTEYAVETARARTDLAALDRRIDELAKSSDKADRELAELAKRLRKTGDDAKKTESGIGRFVKSLGSLKSLLGGLGAAAGFAVLLRGLRTVTEAYAEQQAAEQILESQIRATGRASGFTADQMKRQASTLQDLTGIGDEYLIQQQSFLASFKGVRQEVFIRTIAAAEDMKRVLPQGGEALTQLAKALDQLAAKSLTGVSALRRSGTILTDSQLGVLQSFLDSNQIIEAQIFLLEQVEDQYGGASLAARGVLKGAIQALNSEMGDLQEVIGEIIAGGDDLTDLVDLMVDLTKVLKLSAGELRGLELGFSDLLADLPEVATWLRTIKETLETLQLGAEVRGEVDDLAEAMRRALVAAGLLEPSLEDLAQSEREIAEAAERGRAAHVDLNERGLKILDAAIEISKKKLKDLEVQHRANIRALRDHAETAAQAGALIEGAPTPDVALPVAPDLSQTIIDEGIASEVAALIEGALVEGAEGAMPDWEALMSEVMEVVSGRTGDLLEEAFAGVADSFGRALVDVLSGGDISSAIRSLGSDLASSITVDIGSGLGGALASGAAGAALGAAVNLAVGAIADAFRSIDRTFADGATYVDGVRSQIHEHGAQTDAAAQAVLDGVAGIFDEILAATGASIDTFRRFSVTNHGEDGLAVAVEGTWTRFGLSVDEAIETIVTRLLAMSEFSGADGVMQEVLNNLSVNTVEDLRNVLAAALDAEDLGVSEMGARLISTLRQIFDTANELVSGAGGAGLSTLIGGVRGVIGTITSGVEAWLGREQDLEAVVAAEQRAHLAAITFAEVQLRTLEARILAEIQADQARSQSARGRIDVDRLLVDSLMLEARAVAEMSGIFVDSAVATGAAATGWEAALASIAAGLDALAGLREEVEGGFAEAMRRARGAVAGATHQAEEQEDATRAAAAALEELRRRMEEIADAARSVSDRLGSILSEIFELAEGPSGQPASAQRLQDLRERFATEVAEVQRQIAEALAAGDDQLAQTLEATLGVLFAQFAELMEREGEILRRAGLEGLAGLGSAAAQMALDNEAAAASIQYLLDNLEELGLTAEDVAEAVRSGTLDRLLAIAEAEARRVGDIERANELAERRERLARDLLLLEIASIEAQLLAAGALDLAMIKLIARIRGDLELPDVGSGDEDDGPGEQARSLLELAQALGASTAQWIEASRDYGVALAELEALVESGAVTAEQAAAVLQDANRRASLAFGQDLLGFVDRFYGSTAEGEELRRAQLMLTFQLEQFEFRVRFELLRAQNRLTIEQLNLFGRLFAFIDTHTPDWDALLEGVENTGDAAASTGQAADATAQALRSLRDELEGILRSAEDSQLGPFQRELNQLLDTFARAGSILKALGADTEEWNRAAEALAARWLDIWTRAFDPAQALLDEIRQERLSPTERFRGARAAFDEISLPENLADLDPDSIADIVARARALREAGAAQFGTEAFAASRLGQDIEGVLEQLLGLMPEPEDLLVLAIEHLEAQVAADLGDVNTALGGGGAIVNAIEDMEAENTAAAIEALAGQLGLENAEQAAALLAIAEAVRDGQPVSLDLLLALHDIRDDLGADSPIYGQLGDLIDSLEGGVTVSSGELSGLLEGIAGSLGAGNESAAAQLLAIAEQLTRGEIAIDDLSLVAALHTVRDLLGPDHPLFDQLGTVVDVLEGGIAVDSDSLGTYLQDLAGLLSAGGRQGAADLLADIATQLLNGTLDINDQALVDRLLAVQAELGPDHPLYDQLQSALDILSPGLGDRGAIAGALLGAGDATITNRLGQIKRVLTVEGPLIPNLRLIASRLGQFSPLWDRLGATGPIVNMQRETRDVLISIRDGGVGQGATGAASFGGGELELSPVTSRLDAMLLRMNGPAVLDELKAVTHELRELRASGPLVATGL